ncbi:hypothetical protein KXX16_008220 [Aspergillus fumigatus]|nr:hypothetical protein KXX30_001038 [Aspergillus fumigatus]KAH1286195.1 hypothetical protein KXX48_000663 [Aspergillus fumigatus]KAH1308699.1 hypothetical protein KXX66_001560 [Aspergillus fumigatus]KAH1320711.1 hypothetical protein KXX38_009170 [Aspergillus fumigatus]KAH1328361.1 hypothetical protein KXX47_008215 [Aspergillus fumigatus]
MTLPANDANSQTHTSANKAPPMRFRRPKIADPLVRPKKRVIARPAATSAPSVGIAAKPTTRPVISNVTPATQADKAAPGAPQNDFSVNGFSGPLLSETYVDYPIVITKRSLRVGLKHHIARFASKKTIDPRDESQFTRPVRLQRRDPRAKTQELNQDKGQAQKLTPQSSLQLGDAEREELEARKAAREKERAENLAQIAPSMGSAPKRSNIPKQRTQQVSKTDMTPEEVARARIKYEEALPWHLEDFDNKNIWVGNYEAALSETHAVFIPENGRMRMIPVEKWYKFGAKNQFRALTIEEAERFMAKKIKDPRWFMEKQQEQAQRKELEQFARQRKVYAGKQGTPAGADGLEADEMDFEEDRFADDEEHDDLFNEDEETKAAEKRIKQDQLKANVFDLKDEKDYEEEELREKREREARRILGKKVRKALKKREKNYDYSSGSDANPYSDDESSDDSEAERLREEERKAEEDKNKKDSAPSTRGNVTPSGRPKHTEPLKKGPGAASRKRLGSPNVSDASGTDTSRKKAKSKHSSQPTPQPTSRALSPTAPPGQVGKKRIRNVAGAGSVSDADGGAASGGEMSESGKIKKLKLNPPAATSQGGTPQGSRAGSPTPIGSKGLAASRASSPESLRGQARIATPVPSGTLSFPTPAEIHAAIPQTGILSSDLLKIFRPRIGESKENHRKFIAIVKDVGVYGKEDRLLRPGVLKDGQDK